MHSKKQTMKKRITVVEDDEDIRDIVGYLLESQYELTLLENLSLFRESLGHGKPDLVILDVMLPDGDGREMCCEMTADPQTADVPILLMSAHTQTVPKGCAAVGFLPKPFNNSVLTQRVAALLS